MSVKGFLTSVGAKLVGASQVLGADGSLIRAGYVPNYNLINNGHFEENLTGWNTYANTPGVTPVNGTGGSPTITITRESSFPLRGSGSLSINKPSSNAQGQGVSIDFTAPTQDRSGPVRIQFDYTDGNFVAGNAVSVFLYDVGASSIITPANNTISAAKGKMLLTANLNTGASYRLIFHIAGTSATATQLLIDSVFVGAIGSVTSTYTATWSSGTSFVATHNLNSRDVAVAVYDTITYDQVDVEINRTSVNSVTVSSLSAPTNPLQVVVMNPSSGSIVAAGGGGTGTVTSVALTAPADLTVSGSPITTSGTIAITRASQAANLVLASPNGSSGTPTYRALAVADLPTIPIASGGSGQTTANAALNAFLPSQTGNSGKVLSTNGTNTSWATVSGTGTVTSVALALPSFITVSGSPVTAAGTLTGTLASQTANTALIAPNGSSGAPTFRALVAADIPNLDTAKITTGTLAFARGGTGATTFANQRIPFSNGTVLTSDGNFIYDTTNIRLSVGGSGTAAINGVVSSGSKVAIQAFSTGTNNVMQVQGQGTSGYNIALVNAAASALAGSSIGGQFQRGTLASPTQSLSGDQLFSLTAQGHTGSVAGPGFTNAISFVASENTTSSANGGELVLSTTPNGALLPVERLRVKQDGNLILANQAEFRFNEALINGTTYAALKAPASIVSSFTLTLPTALPSSTQALQSSSAGVLSYTPVASSASFKADWITADGTTKTITHSLNSLDVMVQIFDESNGQTIAVTTETRTDVNTVTLTAGSAPGASGWRVLILALY